MHLGSPLTLYLREIRGAIFTDIAATRNENNLRITEETPEGERRLRDLQVGFGFGPRIRLGFLLLQWDIAWRTDLLETSKPNYYFSLGAEL